VIRGSIEIVKRTQVAGWIHAEAGSVRDRLILAFAGERCVGAGKVDRFRKDLLEAKLGDGYCGFDFPIRLDDDEKLGAVTVRLQNSDAALIPRTTRLVGPDDIAPAADLGAIPPGCVAWMQDRGWLGPQDAAFLKAIQTIGAYEHSWHQPRPAPGRPGLALGPAQAARDLLSLYALSQVSVSTSRIASISQLAGQSPPMREHGLSLMALWSAEPCRVALEERSHIEAEPGRDGALGRVTDRPAPGAIEYGFGPTTMLFLHRHASFSPDSAAPPGGTVFTATAHGAAAAGEDLLARRAAVAA
jgi:hypothetical protein